MRTGEPKRADGADSSLGDYPRAYGGTDTATPRVLRAAGLSPCVRGNQEKILYHGIPIGTIPVRTGEPGNHGREA